MIVYGRGCAGCQTIPQSIQPLQAKELPETMRHGNVIAYSVYGCRCIECQEWQRRDRKEGKRWKMKTSRKRARLDGWLV